MEVVSISSYLSLTTVKPAQLWNSENMIFGFFFASLTSLCVFIPSFPDRFWNFIWRPLKYVLNVSTYIYIFKYLFPIPDLCWPTSICPLKTACLFFPLIWTNIVTLSYYNVIFALNTAILQIYFPGSFLLAQQRFWIFKYPCSYSGLIEIPFYHFNLCSS